MEKLNRREAIKGIALVAGSTLISCGQEDSATKGGNGQSSGCTKKESNGEGKKKEESKKEPEKKETLEVFDLEKIPLDEEFFPYAVQAGAVSAKSALLCSCVEKKKEVFLKVWSDSEEKGKIIPQSEQKILANNGGFVRKKIESLSAGNKYKYAFFIKDEAGTDFIGRSIIGSFKAGFKEDYKGKISVAITACNGIMNAPWPALIQTSKHDYDVFMHLGDMAYNDAYRGLSGFRGNWKRHLKVEGFKKSLSKSAFYGTWDDHEVTNNWNPESIDKNHFKNAKDSYFEAIAVEKGPNDRLWNSYKWGNVAEVFLLDCRSERKPSGRFKTSAEYISNEQMKWLKNGLRNSKCHFKLIMNSVPITHFTVLSTGDTWMGYKSQRNELLDLIKDENISNVWFLSGDLHMCFVSKINKKNEGLLDKTYEIGVTGGNINPIGDLLRDKHHLYSTGFPKGCLIDFDPIADNVRVRYLNPSNGNVDKEFNLSQKA